MDAQRRSRWLDALAWAAALPALLTPISNPDLFWHLASAERILAGGLPTDDSLSFTRMGWPWLDFEWLAQLLYFGVHGAAGWWGLWALKALLMALCALCAWALAGLHGTGGLRRVLLLAWAAASLARSELKPELFSVILFSLELAVLESLRLGRMRAPSAARAALAAAAFFAFWANLHPGFAAGLLLLAVWCLAERGPDRAALWAALGAGILGVLANPYGWGVYWVLFQHALWLPAVSRHILEWMPPKLTNPYHWPLFLLSAALIGAWARRWRAHGPPPVEHLAAGALFGAWSFLQARQEAYLLPVALLSLAEAGAREPSFPRRPAALGAALCAAFTGWMAVPELRKLPFDFALFPVQAADFIEREREVLRNRRVYNEWGWGGYLTWRFGADLRVFMDGRYLFHPLLAETARANGSPEGWAALLDKYGVEWALLLNRPAPLRVLGTSLLVPHLDVYMPRARWALVHEDAVARLYVRRGSLPRDWIEVRERPVRRRE